MTEHDTPDPKQQLARTGFAVVEPDAAYWRDSALMHIPNTNLAEQLGARLTGLRLWRLPPYSANTWHKHPAQEELYYVLEGVGRIRIGDTTLRLEQGGSIFVLPHVMRQVFNDTPEEALWLVCGAPRFETADREFSEEDFYPEDPTQLPPELAGHESPPAAGEPRT